MIKDYLFKIIALTIISFQLLTPSLAQGVNQNKIMKSYYISSTQGNDDYDGLTELTPKQHISSIGEKNNICIKLKRDDVFFEQLRGYSNCIIEDYGKGEQPVVCGFKVLTKPQAWCFNETDECWVIDLMDEENFLGLCHGDEPDRFINNIGFIYDSQFNKVYGHRVREQNNMVENGDFFMSEKFATKTIDNETFRYLRWRTDVDPRNIEHLCFSTCLIGVNLLKNCEVRNIAIVGFNFGIANCSNTTIDNCKVDLIGGAVQIGMQDWIRYGNGIEFWYNCHDNTVKNCIISRTYDCATSIQARGEITSSPKNIHFINNSFYHCRQAFEFFLNATNGYNPEYLDCSFTDNICLFMGENEFSTPELRDANLLSYDWRGKSITIANNIFFGAPHIYRISYPTGMKDNIIYLYIGQYLCHRFDGNLAPVFANNYKDITDYRMQSGDNSKIVILKRGSKKASRIERKLWKQLNWKPVNLHLERL